MYELTNGTVVHGPSLPTGGAQKCDELHQISVSEILGQADLVKLVDQRYDRLMDVTVQEAKTQLSKLLRRVEAGEEITIRRGSEPVAVLIRAPKPAGARQIWGDLEGGLEPDFDAPLPDFQGYS